MTALAALAYADWRAFVNDMRRVRRSPGRLAIWIGYALVLTLFFVSRAITGGRFGAGSPRGDVVRADYFMCALLVTLALSLATGRGAIGIFRSRVEARFVIGSPIAAPLAIAYLQAREALAQGLRLVFSFIYFIFIFGPRRIGPIAMLADVTLVLAIVSAAAAVVVPRRLLPRPAGIACALVGFPLAFVALAPALRDIVAHWPLPVSLPAPLAVRILALVPPWHPGEVLLEPRALWLLAVLAVATIAIAVLASSGRDAYPELYALSIARIDRIERLRQRRTPRSSPATARRSAPAGLPAPAGVLVYVWKSVIEFRRQASPPFIAAGVALWCAGGFTVARLIAADDGALFATLFGVVTNIMLIVGISATSAISGEVRRPLFWLSRSALFERLCALALARIWRTIATLELVAVGFSAGGGKLLETLVFSIALPALVALLAGIGFAAFTVFPNGADWRGPIAALRFGVSALLLVPPLALYLIAALVVSVPLAALVAATLLALIEAAALIGVAAWRLDGRIDRIPG